MTGNPMVTLNRARRHRLHSARADLLELAGDTNTTILEFRAAVARTTNLREQQSLTTRAAHVASERADD
jgi:predicted RNA polymerase sigma factor